MIYQAAVLFIPMIIDGVLLAIIIRKLNKKSMAYSKILEKHKKQKFKFKLKWIKSPRKSFKKHRVRKTVKEGVTPWVMVHDLHVTLNAQNTYVKYIQTFHMNRLIWNWFIFMNFTSIWQLPEPYTYTSINTNNHFKVVIIDKFEHIQLYFWTAWVWQIEVHPIRNIKSTSKPQNDWKSRSQ